MPDWYWLWDIADPAPESDRLHPGWTPARWRRLLAEAREVMNGQEQASLAAYAPTAGYPNVPAARGPFRFVSSPVEPEGPVLRIAYGVCPGNSPVKLLFEWDEHFALVLQ